MPYFSEFRKHARALFRRAKPALLVVLLLLSILSPFITRSVRAASAQRSQARIGMASGMISDMNTLYQIGEKMRFNGADIQGGYLAEIKKLLFSLSNMNAACARSFGSEYAPIDERFLRKLHLALSELEWRYARGENAEAAEETLAEYLRDFKTIMNARFTEDTDIIPFRP